MENKQNILLISVFLLLAGLSAWLQFGLLESSDEEIAESEKNDPDYYVENFTSQGIDSLGRSYEIISDRLVHYPVGDRVLLDNPIIIQYESDGTARRVSAESGWLYNNRRTVLLTGNVRVIEGGSDNSVGGVASTKKMVIHLDQDRG
ncbi:MAG: LPS export ABC transporter periplasmic protein LptC [Gammaproteobacteria bacterium]|nr:LPS export ABC transporter periplasmic protein LptC [Gammaproteobacteria bacterium]